MATARATAARGWNPWPPAPAFGACHSQGRFDGQRTGGPWRCLPHDGPPGNTGSHAFRRWRKAPVWGRWPAQGREPLRGTRGRAAQPRAGLLDRQRVKTPGLGGARGEDGAPQIQGRKRPLRGATHGLGRTVNGPPAALRDRDGVALLWPPEPLQAAVPCRTPVGLEAGDNGTANGRGSSRMWAGHPWW
jgi:hypothetical protein